MNSFIIISASVMLILSAWASVVIAPGHSRLPITWSPGSRPHWMAPRAIALLITPAIFVAVMLVIPFLPTETGERDLALLALAFAGPAIHGLHLLLLRRAMHHGM
jgi:hypothetical protein